MDNFVKWLQSQHQAHNAAVNTVIKEWESINRQKNCLLVPFPRFASRAPSPTNSTMLEEVAMETFQLSNNIPHQRVGKSKRVIRGLEV